MKKLSLLLLSATVYISANAQQTYPPVRVGGADMVSSRNILQNASNSADHTALVAIVKASGLVSTFEDNGPYTVFAPTNAAFDKVPKASLNSLLRPENKPALVKLLTYHVVSGKWDAASIIKKIKDGNGKAQLTTLSGGTITASLQGDKILLTDEKGGTALITIKDVYQSNGLIQVVDGVLMPM